MGVQSGQLILEALVKRVLVHKLPVNPDGLTKMSLVEVKRGQGLGRNGFVRFGLFQNFFRERREKISMGLEINRL